MTLSLVLTGGQRIEVDRALIAGRHASSDIVLDDLLVSERHLRISPLGDQLEVADLGSTNGTFVNGTRISRSRPVRHGDVIRVGALLLTVQGQTTIGSSISKGVRLLVRTGPDAGLEATIAPGQSFLIGRAETSDLMLTDPLVSAAHCQISLATTAGSAFCMGCGLPIQAGTPFCTGCGHVLAAVEVKDLGSSNGVLVNRALLRRGTRQAVTTGAEIQLGDTVIVVEGTATAVTRGPAPTMYRPLAQLPTFVGQEPARTSTAQRLPTAVAPSRRTITLPQFDVSRLPVRLIAILAAVVGTVGVVIVAVAVVAGGLGDGPHDAAWIRSEMGPATVQIAAYSEGSSNFQTGSGSAIDSEAGLILTNFHVLANDYGTTLANLTTKIRLDESSDWLDARVVGYSGCDDLALLQIDSPADREGLKPVSLADTGAIRSGTTVVALGFPGTLETLEGSTEQMTVTQGIISKTGVSYTPYRDLIQIDADINHGSSGGPLFDLDGHQVGVNTLGMSDAQGVNYAISASRVLEVLPELRTGSQQAGDSCNS